jgi:uncharacterized protein (TIGR00369 family)
MTGDLGAFGRKVLAQQPFSQLVGIELDFLEMGRAGLSLKLRPEHLQQHGVAHGGVVATLADLGLAYAGGPLMGESAMTAEFKINYVRPGTGEKLVARAEVVAHGRAQAVVRCDVFAVTSGAEKLCATAQGTIARGGGQKEA